MSGMAGNVVARPSPTERSSRGRGRGALFWCCAVWLVLIAALVLFADLLPLAEPAATLTGPPRSGPSSDNLLGTDALGRDILARVVYGARISLGVGLGATVIAVVLGGLIGTIAGYLRGWVDTVVSMGIDAVLAFPSLIVALLVVTFVGSSVVNVTLVLGVLTAPAVARVVRGSTIAVREREYVVSSRVLGARRLRTIRRDILPNIVRPVLSFAFLLVGVVIVAEGSLAFLGLSVPPPTPTWGGMIEEGRISLDTSVWATLVPSAVLVMTVLALNWIHDVALTDTGRPPVRRASALRHASARRATEPPRAMLRGGGPEAPAGSAPGTGDVLRLQDMTTTFDTPAGLVRAVDGVSISVAPGRTLGIVGESGSGKSVLLRSFLRIVTGDVAERDGRAWFAGTEVTSLSDAAFTSLTKSRIGVVVQDTSSALNPVRTIGSQLREQLRQSLKLRRREADHRARELLSSVGISDPERRLKQYPHQLSGGMRQRVLIAMALIGDPDLLLADEPTTALDVTVQHQVLRLLHEARDARGAAMVLVSHDLPLVAQWADDVVVMYRGRVVESGPAADVLTQPRMPYTRALLDAVPDPFHEADQLMAISAQSSGSIESDDGCGFAPRCPRVTDRCRMDAPPLAEVGPDAPHRFACWHPLGGTGTDTPTSSAKGRV